MDNYKIKHKVITPYHPHANGKVEGTNRILEEIMTKTFILHLKDWADRLLKFLWAYRIIWITTTKCTPYELVYGKRVLLPIETKI
jgi:hypothetical protein